MAKAIAVSSAELKGIGVALAEDLAQAVGVSVGDYVLITASNGVKAPGIVSRTTSLRNTCLLSNELTEALGLSKVSIVEVARPQVDYAKRIYVEIIGGKHVNLNNLRMHLYDIPLLNKAKAILSINGEMLRAVITVDLGEENKIYRIDSSTEIHILAINFNAEGGEAEVALGGR